MRCVVLVLVAHGALARADGMANLGHTIGGLAFLGELALPDVRAEHSVTTGASRWVLSWPLALRSDALAVGSSGRVNLAHAVEYQHALRPRAHRGLLVERATWSPASCDGSSRGSWSPLLEVGGVLGQDGAGLIVGAGVGRAERADLDRASFSAFALVVRLAVTDAEARVDVALDLLQLPFDAF